MNKVLYRFVLDCGRMGEIESLFIAPEETVDNLVGREIYFGEVLGKHSEIYCTFNRDQLTVLSEDQDHISWLSETIGTKLISHEFKDVYSISGMNPFEFAEEDYEDDE